ncbi:MAG: hypothetical protein N3D74_06165 [Caldisericia bacterium]|nr:hypothetical protein [Caldisericia bacterium]
MRNLIGNKGFALITVFIVSMVLVGVVGFTFISANRQLNLKNLLSGSKRAFTVADGGLEYMINMVQSYHFYTLAEYLAFENNLGEPIVNLLKTNLDAIVPECSNINSVDKQKIISIINNSFSNYISKGQYFYDFYSVDLVQKKLKDASGNVITIDTNPDLGSVKLSQKFSIELSDYSNRILNESFKTNCSSCIEAIYNKIKSDVENSYNIWANYVKEKVQNIILDFGGLTTENIDYNSLNKNKIIIPYDIDYPVEDGQYEGILVRTADVVEIYTSDIDVHPTRKLIISAVSYVFNKQVPYSVYNTIKTYFDLVWPREEDAEYKKYPLKGSGSNVYPQINKKIYVNALDVDKTNGNLKTAGYSYQINTIRRAIRAEFQIPFIIGEQEPSVTLFRIPGTTVRWNPDETLPPPPDPPSQIYVANYTHYLIATNNDITLPSSEFIYGPVRTNNRVNFYGTTNDVIIARKYVDYKGKFKFIYNGIEYIVNFSTWSPQNPTQLPITPPLNGSNTVGIRKSIETIIDQDGIERAKNWYIDVNGDNQYTQGVDKIFLVYTNNSIPLTDPNASNSLINQAKQEILSKTQGTPYYVVAPNNGYIEVDVQNNTLKYRVNGKGGWESLNISSNPGSVMYVVGDVYFKGGGFLDGKLTIYATGDVHFEGGPVRYRDDPKSINDWNFPSDTTNIDMLGIITPKKVYLTNNSSNSMKVDVNILAGGGIVSDKNNPNKIKIQGSIAFYDTYTGEYRYELLNFDYNLFVTRPPSFPLLNMPCPTPPVLVSPDYGITGVSLKPTFVWKNSFGAPPITYTIQIATDGNFNNIIFSQNVGSNTTFTLSQNILNQDTIYYWRVRATNNSCSDVSAIFYFRTQKNQNDQPTEFTISDKFIAGKVLEAYFSRRLWREMANPP